MTSSIRVGDPAISSLSSCLCSFPGGFSLLTETGQLRPFLVTPHSNETQLSAGSGAPVPSDADIVAAEPLQLSSPRQQGSFPVDGEIPVDHAWSPDGRVLVVLRRSSFSIYLRGTVPSATAPTWSPHDNMDILGGSGVMLNAVVSLDLILAQTIEIDSEGKVVVCSLLRARRSGNASGDQDAYMVAVGGSFGIECHALHLGGVDEVGNNDDATPAKADASRVPGTAENALSTFPDSSASRRKKAAVKGNRKCDESQFPQGATASARCRPLMTLFCGYRVVAITVSPDAKLMAAVAMTGHLKVWDVSSVTPMNGSDAHDQAADRGHGSSAGGSASAARDPSRKWSQNSVDAVFLWGETLPIARATSLRFSPDDCRTFALACWDGQLALFSPVTTSARGDERLPVVLETSGMPRTRSLEGSPGTAGEVRAWRAVWRQGSTPGIKGHKKVKNLEDQSGAYVCWLCWKEVTAPTTALAISTSAVRSVSPYSREDYVKDGTPGESRTCASAGPGVELLGERLEERSGGAVCEPDSAAFKQATQERLLIRGMAAGSNCIALYDSTMSLHVMSVRALLEGRCLRTPHADRTDKTMSASELMREPLMRARSVALGEVSSSLPPRPKRTLVSNDHGLVVATSGQPCREPDDLGRTKSLHPYTAELSVTWRDALTGLESVDEAESLGKALPAVRLPLLFPDGHTTGEGDDDANELIGADVRCGHLILLTRRAILDYWGGDPAGTTGGSPDTTRWTWRPCSPLLDGVLMGGKTIAKPLSVNVPKPSDDLMVLYVLAVLETDEDGFGPVVDIRSLSDRGVNCRCQLWDADADEGERSASHAAKVYVSPDYGGGNFVIAAHRILRSCALFWRGTFVEANARVKVAPVIDLVPPSPVPLEVLSLTGVAGPNCELLLFQEAEVLTPGSALRPTGDRVRWWLWWPEMGRWNDMEAPARLAGEDLGVADFVKIFQMEIEDILSITTDSRRS